MFFVGLHFADNFRVLADVLGINATLRELKHVLLQESQNFGEQFVVVVFVLPGWEPTID